MRMPEIKGTNKIRDAKIIWYYNRTNMSKEDIAHKMDLCVSSIEKIVYKNKNYVEIDKSYERQLQIKRVKKKIAKAKPSTKDVHDWEKLLADLTKEEKSLVDQSVHNHYQQVKVVIDDNSNISSALQSRVSPTRPK